MLCKFLCGSGPASPLQTQIEPTRKAARAEGERERYPRSFVWAVNPKSGDSRGEQSRQVKRLKSDWRCASERSFVHRIERMGHRMDGDKGQIVIDGE